MSETQVDDYLDAGALDGFNADQPPTRPAVASRKARRPKEARKVTRYTLDLEREQHAFLRLYALQNETEASKVMRTLLYLLEADASLQQRVYGELFAEELTDENDATIDEDQ